MSSSTTSPVSELGTPANFFQALFTAGHKPEIGYLLALLLPSIAATASFQHVRFGGINFLTFVTSGIPFTLVMLMIVKAGLDPTRLRIWPGIGAWIVWYGMIWFSLLHGVVRDGDAVKHAFEMSTPILFGLAGAMFIRTEKQLSLLLDAMLFAVVAALGCVAIWKLGFVEVSLFPTGPALDPRPHSMSLLPIAALSIAMVPTRMVIPVVVWTLCLLISGIEGSRGVTLCILVLPLFHPTFRGIHWKALAAVMVVVMALIVFHLPPMQARLFPDTGSGTISDLFTSKQSGMGRFEAWPKIFEKATETPILGHGVSSAFHYVPLVWTKMRSPHNEFIGMFYEFGLVGLSIYVSVFVYQIVLIRKKIRESTGVRVIALAAVFLSFIAFNFMACTDNPLSSNVRFLNPVFLLMGAAFCAEDNCDPTA